MTNPTPEEITAAYRLLFSVPGFTDRTTLADVAAVLEPTALLAASLKGLLVERDVDIRDAHFMDIATLLSDLAARQDLRITTAPEPGELAGYDIARCIGDGQWAVNGEDGHWPPTPEGLARTREKTSHGGRAAAVYLLPEGGKA